VLSAHLGAPAILFDSTLHIHPLTKEFSENGDYVGSITTDKSEGRQISFADERSERASSGWHSDITFEPVPSDYAGLRITTLPETGGDTLWASAYSAYDALSPAFARFLETLTATHDAPSFRESAARHGFPLRHGPRGAPENVGDSLRAVHPLIRVNPVTGWKGLYVNKYFTSRINELTKDESDDLLQVCRFG
jgi:alpha-ketoglutarate-dependent taurine dioxygenase